MNMTTYEKCKNIRRMIVNRAAEVMNYSWDDDFSTKWIRLFPDGLKEQKKHGVDYFGIQPSDLTETEMMELGFGVWSEETPMRLIPLWLYPFLADEITVESIIGKKATIKRTDIDTDNRFGCLAFGVIPRKEKP